MAPLELAADLTTIYARTKAADRELKALVEATESSLMDLHGIGPSGAARLLVEVGDITRFPDRNHFASWTGTAPIDASSGEHVRHRLSRGGNRQINRVLHIMAVVQLRTRTTEGRVYYDRKKAAGKTSMEAVRCLNGACPTWCTGPCSTTSPGTRGRAREGTWVTTLTPARPAHNPLPALRTSHFPDPRIRRYPPDPTPSQSRQLSLRAGAPEPSRWSAPPDERR